MTDYNASGKQQTTSQRLYQHRATNDHYSRTTDPELMMTQMRSFRLPTPKHNNFILHTATADAGGISQKATLCDNEIDLTYLALDMADGMF